MAAVEYALGAVDAYGEARRRDPAWGAGQDNLATAAAEFLRVHLPRGVSLEEERDRDGISWVVTLGARPANVDLGTGFRQRFRGAEYRTQGGVETFRLRYASPSAAWGASRGRAAWRLYFFLALALAGAMLTFSPETISRAFR